MSVTRIGPFTIGPTSSPNLESIELLFSRDVVLAGLLARLRFAGRLAFVGALTTPLLAELATLAGEVLGWTDSHIADELTAVTADLAERHQVVLEAPQVTAL